jgi:3-dehydroquinate dehydratase-2
MKILILNGPNLNLLGRREPAVYGSDTLESILAGLEAAFPEAALAHFQSNHEGALIDRIHEAVLDPPDGAVVNLGALTHYSYALLDALRMLPCPIVEVHLSHLFSREPFRHVSVISPACKGMISGFGKHSYHLALQWLLRLRS